MRPTAAQASGPVISLMLAVPDAPTAVEWNRKPPGPPRVGNLGWVAGLEIAGAPFFLHEPANNGFGSPAAIGTTTVRVEVFADDPGTYVERAIKAGADGALDPIRDHQTPWGTHRQGGFHDPFGHIWLVGDKSPLRRFRG